MKTQKGFTVIEILVVTFIASIVGVGVITSIASSNKMVNDSVLHTMSSVTSQQLLYDLSKDVKNGVALSTNSGSNYDHHIIIHNTDGTTIQWKYESSYGGDAYALNPVRIDQNGNKRTYEIPIHTKGYTYAYFYPYFYVNTDMYGNPVMGQYHRLRVYLYTYEYIYDTVNGTGSYGYENFQTRAVYSCRHEAAGFGF